MIDRGLGFVPATGRTRDNAIGAIQPLKLNLPIICDNGTFVYNISDAKFERQKTIDKTVAIDAIDKIIASNVSPLINTLEDDNITVFYSELKTEEQRTYFDSRTSYGLSRYIKDHSYSEYKKTNVFNLSMLDTHENLVELYEHLVQNENLTTVMFPAHYFPNYYWLEVLPPDSGKGQSVDYLVEKYKPRKVVCFGDNLNDLCMFERADVKIATENAVDEIKEQADIVIGHCNDNSVAQYILNDFK